VNALAVIGDAPGWLNQPTAALLGGLSVVLAGGWLNRRKTAAAAGLSDAEAHQVVVNASVDVVQMLREEVERLAGVVELTRTAAAGAQQEAAQLRVQVAELTASNVDLMAQVALMTTENAALAAEVGALRAELASTLPRPRAARASLDPPF
jgi:hypothetical protein